VAACVAAVPVAAAETCAEIRSEVNALVCAATPEPFYSVGAFYEDFSQVDDTEVRRLLDEAAHFSS
jgi:putative phosphoribosyl transferase